MVGQLVPEPLLVNESVVVPKIVRTNRIQEPIQEQTLVVPALQVVEELHETLFSNRAKLFRMRDGKWEDRGLGDAKLHLHRKNKPNLFYDEKGEHHGNYRQFLRAQRL